MAMLCTVAFLNACGSDKRTDGLEQKIDSLLNQMTLEEKVSLVHANSKFTVAGIDRLGIEEMTLSDGPHGVRPEIERYSWNYAGWDNDHATYLPHLTSVAASWDPEIALLHGQVLGAEARERGKDIILGPGVNLARLPLYGRNFEYMGEDPALASILVVPAIKGIQQNDVAATIKHFALNTQELNRTGVNAQPDERTLREVYLPVFEHAVKEADVLAMMGAYNNYYGTNANQSKHLVMDILKGEWGYEGVLLTDWNVDINTYDAAVNGLDIEMGTNVESFDDYFMAVPLIKMVEEDRVPEAAVDDKVRRVLRLQHKIGMYDANRKQGSRNTTQHQMAARKIAEEGVVLLKNEAQLLPLKSDVKNILVLGPNADAVHGFGGGSSEVKAKYEITPLEGLMNEFGQSVEITYMRARPEGVVPIAADYVVSRHWTGTPAWHVDFFADPTLSKKVDEASLANSEFDAKGKLQHLTMTGSVKVLHSGLHKFTLKGNGDYLVKLDDKTILPALDRSSDSSSIELDLVEGETYKVAVEYHGKDKFTLGWDTPKSLYATEKEYLDAAKMADAVIYFGGLSHADDREAYDRVHMGLPNSQNEIISKVLDANENTVVFLIAGSAVAMPWIEKAKTVVWGWYGGMEAGNAFANILSGDVNPSGKLPITLPKKLEHTAPIALDDYNAKDSFYKEGVFIGYRWFEKENIKPLFAFGHGKSYTDFDYSGISLSADKFDKATGLTVTATIKNVGKVAGSEVVQLYLRDLEASVDRPLKELKGFKKVYLEPGESKVVSIDLKLRDLSFWDINTNDWLAEPGEFEVQLGSSSDDIRLTKSFVHCEGNNCGRASLKTDETEVYGWTLVWSDEFESAGLDPANWNRQVVPAGRFNKEWQRYTAEQDNAYVNDGMLVIKAINESDQHGLDQYTSARLNTAGKHSWKHGKVQARMKLPYGPGLWPAFWMLGENIDENGGDTPWPASGEIDIMEMYGSKGDGTVEANIHYAGLDGKHAQMGAHSFELDRGRFADDFHIFEMEWDEEKIIWSVDGQVYAEQSLTGSEYTEFHKPFFILLNIAVGGEFAGRPNASTEFPQYLYTDWIRVYQRKVS
ncbi:hypothetical protein GCM10011369_05610 [Neiella marina]|uniref:Beta-D-glucoside glucohydrolase n=1 Tax=Neiella marina TaxID=508461 RepID=A0A8J2U2J1_9GAMM|nr:glycoside hydrolase family 3 C-terminal domain-containing protein [Neiella marina]GGA66888.1 hypothetical protein GCM10011369_05610 [Neiella marina]